MQIRPLSTPLWERRIKRLEEEILKLKKREDSLSRYRLLTFFGGLAAILLAYLWGPLWLSWSLLALIIGLFVVLVVIHSRISDARSQFELYRDIVEIQAAKHGLNWKVLLKKQRFHQGSPLEFFELSLNDRQTLEDLDFFAEHGVLKLLDCTFSHEARKKLIENCIHDASQDEILERQGLQKELLLRRAFRRKFLFYQYQAGTQRLFLGKLLEHFQTPFAKAGARKVFAGHLFLTLLSHALLLLYLLGAVPLMWIPIAYFGSYLFLNFSTRYFPDLFEQTRFLRFELRKYIPLLRFLQRSRFEQAPHLEKLTRTFREPKTNPQELYGRLGRYLELLSARGTPIVHFFLHLIFPFDLYIGLSLEKLRPQYLKALEKWSDITVELEVAVSVSEFSDWRTQRVFAEILNRSTSDPVFSGKGLVHPLIAEGTAVANDLEISSRQPCLLITGSNMSGKSTFLRSLGLNLLLVRLGACVAALELKTRAPMLLSAIRISDSLENQFSSFCAEVKRLRYILNRIEDPSTQTYPFFLVDEIYRGTNNKERLQGARAFIRRLLTLEAAGLVTTHDLDLTQLEEESPRLKNYHFKESFDQGQMVFHYKLNEGPCPSTNALKIMEEEGLPT